MIKNRTSRGQYLTMFMVLFTSQWVVKGTVADEPLSPKKFLQAWATAWETSDIDKMMSFYDPGKETTAIESLGYVRKGTNAIRKMYKGAFEGLAFKRTNLTFVAHGQRGMVAWATCIFKADLLGIPDHAKLLLEVRGTFVMKKTKKGWKITLEHFSTIPNVPRIRGKSQ